MTGFASAHARRGRGNRSASRCRSVNHRFLDVQLRLPAALAAARGAGCARSCSSGWRADASRCPSSRAAARRQRCRRRAQRRRRRSGRGALDRARERGLVSGALTRGATCSALPQALSIRERPTDASADAAVVAGSSEAAVAAGPRGAGSRCGAPRARFLRADLDARRALLGDLFDRAAQAAAAGGRALPRRGWPNGSGSCRADPPVDESTIAQEIVRFAAARTSPRRWSGSARTSSTGAPCRTARSRAAASSTSCLQEMNREINTIGVEGRGRRRAGARRRARRRSSRRCASRSRMSSSAPAGACCFVVSAPSGTGKTTIVERLVQVVPDLSAVAVVHVAAGPGRGARRRGL